jgi:acetyl-CoA acetyltransferase
LYGFGKSSPGELSTVLSQQLDPYYLSPLWVDTIAFAAMQARALLETGKITETQMAEVVVRSRANAKSNPKAQMSGDFTVDQLLSEPMYQSPLRLHDCCPISDGACAMIICTVEKAKEWGVPYAILNGIDHRIETHHIGLRDLTRLESVEICANALGVNEKPIDIAELYAPFSHQELMLKAALGLTDSTDINPSGGVLAGNLMMASGLSRIGEVANRIIAGTANRGVAHATSGPAMQQNLVCVLGGAE